MRLAAVVAAAAAVGVVSCGTTGPRIAAPTARHLPGPTPTPRPEPILVRLPVVTPVPSGSGPEDSFDVRVLVAEAAEVSLPQPGREYAVTGGGETVVLRGPLLLTSEGGGPGYQVGAFSQLPNAEGVAMRAAAAGLEAEVVATDTGLFRVVARPREGEGEASFLQRLSRGGFSDAIAAPAGARKVVVRGSDGLCQRGGAMGIVPRDDYPVDVGGTLFRGDLVARSTGRGIAVIDVLPVEEYLRGVVPAEMGPNAFPELEALKAQAVAARTYAAAHLGDHESAGYDLCSTPACQVYRGVGVEHPLTDRAVRETRGELLIHDGQLIDAMYHSTCGGHTENGDNVFSGRGVAYLKGVACLVPDSTSNLRPNSPWIGVVERLATVAERVAFVTGSPPTPAGLTEALTGSAPDPGFAGLAHAFGAIPAIETLFRPDGPVDLENILEALRVFRLELPPPDLSVERGRWELAFVTRLAELSGRVRAVPGILEWARPPKMFRAEKGEGLWPVTGDELILETRGSEWRPASGTCEPGSRGTLWLVNDRPFLIEVDADREADVRSAWSWWVRELPLEDVGRRCGMADLVDLEVVDRGVSGRAVHVRLRGRTGDRVMRGFEFRRALDLPDSLFVIIRRQGTNGGPVRFLGRGWGHGVGLCQNGAYGLAHAGLDHVRILETYYTGARIGTLRDVVVQGGR